MKREKEITRSRLGRRLLFLFVLCALLPITTLATISLIQVTRHLIEESRSRLRSESRLAGGLIVDRINDLSVGLEEFALEHLSSGMDPDRYLNTPRALQLLEPYSCIALVDGVEGWRILRGDEPTPPPPSESERLHLNGGNPLVSLPSAGNRAGAIWIITPVPGPHDSSFIVAGATDPRRFWDLGELQFSTRNAYTVVDLSTALLYTLSGTPFQVTPSLLADIEDVHSGSFETGRGGERLIAVFWTIPARGRFLPSDSVSRWVVIVSEPRQTVLLPVRDFKRFFILIVLVTLWVVILLSIGQIRRNLVPLEKLQEGTRRIARQEFASRVDIHSGDEFEELGGSFNLMAERLGRQFATLSTITEIDRVVLSALDEQIIVDTILTRTREVLPCRGLIIVLFDIEERDCYRSWAAINGFPEAIVSKPTQLDGIMLAEIQSLDDSGDPDSISRRLPFLDPLLEAGSPTIHPYPIRARGELIGLMVLATAGEREWSEGEREQIRQLIDQFAVALSNARLVSNLDQMNWGMLTALARAIDAKSPWTAGHSERVTTLALQIGKVLGLSADSQEILHRGGLLHDLGKIGIPAQILDKPGRLTPEEMKVMRSHPLVGVRILEPIPAFRDVLPILLQHHERWDGQGYPHGLAGEEIDRLARMLSVADYFDALTSERPYRSAHEKADVIMQIERESGHLFDPQVVTAFLTVVSEQEDGLIDPSPASGIHVR